MLKTRHLLFIFLPAILLAGFIFFIRIVQYEPLYPKINPVDTNKKTGFNIPIALDDPTSGNKVAPKTVVVFFDYGCSHCQEEFTILDQLIKENSNDLKIVWKALPVAKFPFSTEEAMQYAYCANQQNKFLEFSRLAFANGSSLTSDILLNSTKNLGLDQDKFNTCFNSPEPKNYIQRNQDLAFSLNIQAVPTIFINSKQIENPQILEGWKSILNLK